MLCAVDRYAFEWGLPVSSSLLSLSSIHSRGCVCAQRVSESVHTTIIHIAHRD